MGATGGVRAEYWSGRRVLITGHTGFKGTWLTLWLDRLGASVAGLSDAAAPASVFALGEASIRDYRADVADAAAVRSIMLEEQPEVIFHLAAQALVRASYVDPVGTYRTNVLGTAAVLDACRDAPSVRVVVSVTSDKCYANQEWNWGYRETDPLGGRDPYSNSKACAELVTAAYRDSFLAEQGVVVATARAGNVIGGGDWAADRLIPDLVRAVRSGVPLRLRNPDAVRPWQDVRDCLHGYLLLAEGAAHDPALGTAWNFGPDPSAMLSVGALVDMAAARWPQIRWEADPAPTPHEARTLTLDASRARTLLGWSPRIALARAVDDLIGWYRDAEAGADPRQLILRQLAAFETLEAMVP